MNINNITYETHNETPVKDDENVFADFLINPLQENKKNLQFPIETTGTKNSNGTKRIIDRFNRSYSTNYKYYERPKVTIKPSDLHN